MRSLEIVVKFSSVLKMLKKRVLKFQAGCLGNMTAEECVFCKIVRGELPAWRIVENDFALGILDTNPTAEGHCLIVPKRHVRYWHNLSDAETGAVFNTAKTVAKQIKKAFKPDFVCVFIRGGRVKHAHIVLFPSQEGDKLSGFLQSVLGATEINLDDVRMKLVSTEL